MGRVIYDEDLINGFIQDCRLRKFTKHTIQSYQSVLRSFISFLSRKGKGILDVDRNTFKEYIAYLFDKKYSYKTVENHFSALSTFYDYLLYEGFMEKNYVLEIRKRYLRHYKKDVRVNQRKLIGIEEMTHFINSIMDIRDKAIALLFAKTGIRRKELIALDVDDVDLDNLTIRLKPTAKRSNRVVFIDYETASVLRKWLEVRKSIAKCNALFVSYETGQRLKRRGVYDAITKWAERAGLHNPNSKRLEDHFTPHCFRHWFTTWLLRNGMPREYVKELRGDARKEAMDLYYHIDLEELKKAYLSCIPKLGVA